MFYTNQDHKNETLHGKPTHNNNKNNLFFFNFFHIFIIPNPIIWKLIKRNFQSNPKIIILTCFKITAQDIKIVQLIGLEQPMKVLKGIFGGAMVFRFPIQVSIYTFSYSRS